mmetsp:Transcript_16138/g.56293  ORF Transcript_16138/g.56293 Transcript_16138/m.56293 type:complete len:326 (+) Transcript_16138:3214-4191(+)
MVVIRREPESSNGRRKAMSDKAKRAVPRACRAASTANATNAVAGKIGVPPTTCCWQTSQDEEEPRHRAPTGPKTNSQPSAWLSSPRPRGVPSKDGGAAGTSMSARRGSSGAKTVLFFRKTSQSTSTTQSCFSSSLSKKRPKHSKPWATGMKRSPGKASTPSSVTMPVSPQPPHCTPGKMESMKVLAAAYVDWPATPNKPEDEEKATILAFAKRSLRWRAPRIFGRYTFCASSLLRFISKPSLTAPAQCTTRSQSGSLWTSAHSATSQCTTFTGTFFLSSSSACAASPRASERPTRTKDAARPDSNSHSATFTPSPLKPPVINAFL